MIVSLLAALAASVLFGAAAVAQGLGARREPGLRVLVQPVYLLGTVGDLVAWGLSLLALRQLPLLTVQTILASSLAVTAALGVVVLGTRPRPIAWGAVLAMVLSCAVVVTASEPGRPQRPPSGLSLALAIGGVVVVLAAVALWRSPRPHWCALLAGLAYSGAAVAGRAVHGSVDSWSGLEHLAGEPLVWLLLGLSTMGAVLFARALQTHAHAVNVAAAWLWATEVVVPAVVGVGWLGDRFRPGWEVPMVLATLVAVAAAVAISLATAPEPAASGAEPGRDACQPLQ